MFSMTRWGRHLGLIASTLLLLFVLPFGLYATHIVGGEMNYRSLGNNNYEITLKVYRDCINGQVGFDDPASVGIFDRDGNLVKELLLPFVGSQPVTNPLNACFTSSSPVCVETSSYVTTVTLSPKVGGYRFVYQRCCRNKTINNIVDPVNTGATYDIILSEAAMLRNNNSPQFAENWPPIYICAGLPFNFNHSAIDVDGDSLVYSLCAPFQGGTFAQPLPQPPMSPPYDEVQFLTSGGYSLDNVLGGTTQPLRVNAKTGLMTAFPDNVGQYVVGFCVQEYDRKTKQLLSITRRDFQYNILRCDRTSAAFVSPSAQCDTLQVRFQNTSTKSTNFKWFFDSPKNTLTSILRDPVFTFPDTGRYKVKLIAEPGTQCVDSTTADIFLQKNSIQANVKVDAVRCSTESILQVEDLSLDKVSGIVNRLWEITLSTGQKYTDTAIKPTFRLPLGANGVVKLTVRTKNGCTQTLERTFNTQSATDPTLVIPDTVKACIGSLVELNPKTPANTPWSYSWSPADNLDNPNAINPKLLVSGNATYNVTLTSSAKVCQFTKQVTILATPKVKAAFTASLACNGYTVNVNNSSTSATKYQWTVGNVNQPLFQSTLPTPNFNFRDTGIFAIQLVATGFCSDTARQTVKVTGKSLKSDFTTNYVSCILGGSTIRFTDQSVNLDTLGAKWLWTLGDGRTSSDRNPIFSFTQGTTTNVTLIVTAANGCKDTMSRSVLVAPITNVSYPETVSICSGGSLTLSTSNSPAYVYSWSPTQGINNPQLVNPTFTPTQSTTYTVNISISGQPTCQISNKILAQVQPAIGLQVSGDGTICGPQATLMASSTNAATYRWLDSNGGLLGTGAKLIVNVSGEQVIQLSAVDAKGCVENRTVKVNRTPLISVKAPDDRSTCGEDALLKATTTGTVTIRWTNKGQVIGTGSSVVVNPTKAEKYFVQITDSFGCTATDSVTVTNNSVNVKLTNPANGDIKLCEVQDVKIEVANQNAGDQLLYNWRPTANIIAGGSTATPTIRVTSGTVTLQGFVTNQFNCRDTVSVNVSVGIIDPKLPSQVLICSKAATPLAPGANKNYSYQWAPATGLSATNVANPNFTGTQSTTYQVTVTDNSIGITCQVVKEVKVIVNSTSLKVIPSDTTICEGTTINLKASGADNYTWFLGDGFKTTIGTSATISVNQPTGRNLFSVIGKNSFGCVDTIRNVAVTIKPFKPGTLTTPQTICQYTPTQINFNGTPGYQYTWSPTIGLDLSNPSAPIATLANSATYKVTVVDPIGGCKVEKELAINVRKITGFTASADTSICAPAIVILRATAANGTTISWVDAAGNPLGNGTRLSVTPKVGSNQYIAIANDGICALRDTVKVSLAAAISSDAGKDTTLCSLAPYSLVGKGTGATRFEWSLNRNFNPILGQGSPFSITPTSGSRYYYLRVTNTSGCTEIDSVKITTAPVQATIPATLNACVPGEEIPVDVVNNDPTQTLRYSWTPTNLILSNPAAGPRAIIKGQDNAQVQVQLTNQFGCKSTLSSTINLADLANKVKFTLDRGTIKVGESTKVTVTGCTNCTFEWIPTTGVSDPKSGTPTLSPIKTTEYRVKVTSGNCMAEFTVKVEVQTPCAEPYIFIPNSFTPNGDGQNDYFRVRGQDIVTIDFRVLNRWGQQMYYSTDPNDIGWDGTFQGKSLPPDVYGYYVVIQCKDGSFFTKKGNVTLFR